MTDAERSEHVRRVSLAIEREPNPERRRSLRIERALWTGHLDELLGVLGDAHPDEVRADPTGEVLLHVAIGIAPPPVLQALIDRGADVNYETNDGFPALVNAIHHETDPERRRAVVRVLIDAEADLERAGHNGWRPIHVAALTDDPTLVRMLLDAGADPHAITTVDDRWTAIEEAELLGHPRGADAIRQWLAEHP